MMFDTKFKETPLGRRIYIYQCGAQALKPFNPTSFPHFLKQESPRRRYCTSFDSMSMQKIEQACVKMDGLVSALAAPLSRLVCYPEPTGGASCSQRELKVARQ